MLLPFPLVLYILTKLEIKLASNDCYHFRMLYDILFEIERAQDAPYKAECFKVMRRIYLGARSTQKVLNGQCLMSKRV